MEDVRCLNRFLVEFQPLFGMCLFVIPCMNEKSKRMEDVERMQGITSSVNGELMIKMTMDKMQQRENNWPLLRLSLDPPPSAWVKYRVPLKQLGSFSIIVFNRVCPTLFVTSALCLIGLSRSRAKTSEEIAWNLITWPIGVSLYFFRFPQFWAWFSRQKYDRN